MTVIDIDSHFMEPLDWLDERFPALAEQLPPMNLVEMVAWSVLPGDDVLAHLPPRMRPAPLDIVPAFLRPTLQRVAAAGSTGAGYAAALADPDDEQMAALGAPWRVKGARDATERLAFVDEHGIDHQFVLPSAPGLDPFIRAGKTGNAELAVDCLYAWNEWAAETLAGHQDRITPVTLVDLADLPRALVEMRRMRERGSRCINVRATTVGGRSLGHPGFERVWSTAEDYGMAIMLHTGAGRPYVAPDWANDGSEGLFNYLTLCASQSHQVPEITIGALILSGVLDRHPALPVLVSEFGISWLPHWLERMDAMGFGLSTEFRPADATQLSLKPSEYAERQLYVSPLPAERLYPTMSQVRGIVAFATDYPHPEGSADASTVFDDQLRDAEPAVVDAFYGAQLAAQLDLRPAA
jgi:predicted TIM-barrel fold metal-dependent hydrolase